MQIEITMIERPSQTLSHCYCFLSCLQISQLIIWPALMASIVCVGFAEMFYSMGKVDCSDGVGSICSLRDSYQLVYFLAAGEPIVNIDDTMTLSFGMTVLAVLFTAIFALLFITVLFLTMMVASKSDAENLALHYYWEPKLTLVISSQSARVAAAQYKKGMWIPQASRLDRLEAKLKDLWGVSMCLLFGIDKNQYWYAAEAASLKALLLKFALSVAVPLWLLVGFLSAGVLWPPQVRLFLFKPRLSLPAITNKPNEGKEFFASQVVGVKDEVVNLKTMTYEQFHDIQQEIHQLKAMIAANLSD